MDKRGRFRRWLSAWADFMYEGLLPPEPPKDKVLYDWKGCCKLCGRPKDNLTKTEWL